jgi:hypothetical protein
MVGRGTSEVAELRNKMKVLEGAVWALVDRVTALEELAEEAERRRRARSSRSRSRGPAK